LWQSLAFESDCRMEFQAAAQIPGELLRAQDVVRVLLKYGLAGWMKGTEWEPARRLLTSHSGEILTDQSFPIRLRLALTDLGTTFVKLGQVLSTRPDLVGHEIAQELSSLQSQTPADSAAIAASVIEKELGRPISECFKEFTPEALASASIGQVHLARLPNNRQVVVKVQHPGIEGTIRRDLNILSKLAALAELREELKRYQPAAIVREFRQTMLRELDFRREMRNLQQFRQSFADDQTVVFPKPYPELTSGRVLTMTYLEGISVGDAEHLHRSHINGEEMARLGAAVFVRMIFRDGFYHADPHPGNLLVLPKKRVGILDGGMVGRIDDELRERIIEILLAAAERDAHRLAEVIAVVCKAPANLDRGGLSADLLEVFGQFGMQSIDQFDVSGALTAVTRIIHEYKLVMPSRLSMLIKCLIILEGTGKALSPKFNLAGLLEPYRQEYLLQQFSPQAWFRKARRMHRDLQVLIEAVPRHSSTILEKMSSGNFAIKLSHTLLESAVNRLVYGVCVGALFLGSALMWSLRAPPTLHGVSVLGALGAATAAALGANLIWTIHRWEVSRRRREE
jgi:ubiquinone biosynthesis protein